MNEIDDSNLGSGETDAVPGIASEEEYDSSAVATEEAAPQRGALMLLMGIIIIGGGGLLIMRQRTGPTSVAASPAAKEAQNEVNAFLVDGGKNLNQMRDLLANTEKVVEQFLAYPSVRQVTVEQLKTNPFLVQKPETPKTVDPTGEQARLAAIAKEKEKEEITKAAGQLQLQSILWSDPDAICMVSGRAYGKGQVVQGFTIENIDRNSVTVRKGEYRFRLSMSKE
jgi:hypothetical protein